ncbi:MAG: hypothetical protein HN377_12830, partial [Alphaproteobacteria bacterium]|nr:hypothetical protein [Alphaproteobacteria bacterium]
EVVYFYSGHWCVFTPALTVVAFNKGLHMLRADTSGVKKRISAFAPGMVNVSFKACGVTMKGMAKKEGKKPELFDFVEVVPAGVAQIMTRDEAGWTIVRP